MSVRLQVVAVRCPLTWEQQAIDEYIAQNSHFVYKQNLHKKTDQYHVIYQKKKYMKLLDAQVIGMQVDDVTLLLSMQEPQFQLSKMGQRGGGNRGRPKSINPQQPEQNVVQ